MVATGEDQMEKMVNILEMKAKGKLTYSNGVWFCT